MLTRFSQIAAAVVATLALVPTASSGTYSDASGDAGSAGDITGVVVEGIPATGQIIFRISGTNLATSVVNPLNLSIDSDSNPLTGDVEHHGTDYWFWVDDGSYWFACWNGSDWVDTPRVTVDVLGGQNQITISVNTAEIGGAAAFNFVAWTDLPGRGKDSAPNDGVFNYSLEVNGPQIESVDVKTNPSLGPRAGKQFVVIPTGLSLPSYGLTTQTPPLPDSYECTAKLATRALAGRGAGGCMFAIPKKNSRGKRLIVVLTVNYQGSAKSLRLVFNVR
jgi:hypothetical protein